MPDLMHIFDAYVTPLCDVELGVDVIQVSFVPLLRQAFGYAQVPTVEVRLEDALV